MTKAEKFIEREKSIVTLDSRMCFSLKKLRAIGNSVYMDLTNSTARKTCSSLSMRILRSADKDRVKSNAARPLAMSWTDKSMRLMTKEQNKAEKVADKGGSGTRGAPGQARDYKQQKENAKLWSSGKGRYKYKDPQSPRPSGKGSSSRLSGRRS